MQIGLMLFMSMRIYVNSYLCLSGIDKLDCIVVLSCFILCLCCDGTTTGVVVPFFVCPAWVNNYNFPLNMNVSG